jgi:glutamate-1-semialdehyde aminotransferase
LKKTQLKKLIPAGFARESLSAKYNEIMSIQRLFKRHPKEIAAVIVELICDDSSAKNLVRFFVAIPGARTNAYF